MKRKLNLATAGKGREGGGPVGRGGRAFLDGQRRRWALRRAGDWKRMLAGGWPKWSE